MNKDGKKLVFSNIDNDVFNEELIKRRLKEDSLWVNSKGVESQVTRLSNIIQNYDPFQLDFKCFFTVYQYLNEMKTYGSNEYLKFSPQSVESGAVYRYGTRMRVFKTGIYIIFYRINAASLSDYSSVVTMSVNESEVIASQISIVPNVEGSKFFVVQLNRDDYISFSLSTEASFDKNFTTFQCTGIKFA